MRLSGNLTARQAAEHYARTSWEEPRQIGKWEPIRPTFGAGRHARFQLVNGVRWYDVYLLADYTGWNIDPE